MRGLQVRDRGREVREVEGREEGGPLDRVGTHGGRCEGRAGRGPDRGRGRRELLGPPGEAMEEVQPHPRCNWRVKAVEEAISRSWIQVARQTCLVHLKRSRRDALDSSPLPSPSPPGLSPYLFAPREAPPRTNRPALQLPPGEFGKYHSSWRIARFMTLNYNLSTCYLILVIL